MATAIWFSYAEESVSKNIAPPKRASSLSQWLKVVAKAIPGVPTNYADAEVDVTPDSIRICWALTGLLYIDRTTRKQVG